MIVPFVLLKAQNNHEKNDHFVHQLRFPEGGAIGTFSGLV